MDNNYKIDKLAIIEKNQQVALEGFREIEDFCKLSNISFLKENFKLRKIRDRKTDLNFKFSMAVLWSKICALSGIKLDIDQFIAEDISRMIINLYSDLTIEEIYKAFELERHGAFETKTEHFQLFNAEYVSAVLKKYKQWKQFTKIQHNIGPENNSEQQHTITIEEQFKIMNNAIIRIYDEFMEYGEVPQTTAERKRKRGDEICEMLEAGKSMRDVYMADRGFYMRNKSHIHSMKHELDMWSHEDGMKPIEQIQLKYRRDPDLIYQDRVIVSWLVKNLCMKRPFKAKQLFITGPPDVGKTHLVNYLSEFLRVYHIPANEDFYDHYTDDVQLCVLDEFKAQKTVQWMNEFLQGSLMSLRKKGSQYLKRSNPPVIILSNYTLEDCYKNQDSTRLESLKCRLLEVHVYQRIEIYDLPEAGHSPGNTKISTDLPPTPQLGDSTPIWNTGPVRMDYEVPPLDHIPFYDD